MPPTSEPQRVGYAVSSVDGTPIYYELRIPPDEGAAGATPVVLCDGIGCDGFIWKYLAPRLASARPVLHWHYRGHGRSPRPKDVSRVSMEDLSDDLSSVMGDAGFEAAAIVGHSMGVQVSLEHYRRHPDMCRALALVCGAASEPLKTFKGSPLLDTLLPTMRSAVNLAPRLLAGIGRRFLPRDWVYDLATKFELQEQHISRQDFMPYLKGLAHMDPDLFLGMLAQAGHHSALDLLPEIRVPCLVVAGEIDTFTPPDLSRNMVTMIPGAELLVVHEGSHTAPLEHPELIGTVVEDFLARALDRSIA